MRRRISQREAIRLRKRVEALEAAEAIRAISWKSDWPGGIEVTRTAWPSKDDTIPTAIRVARRLGHAVVAIGENQTGEVRFVALPLKATS